MKKRIVLILDDPEDELEGDIDWITYDLNASLDSGTGARITLASVENVE